MVDRCASRTSRRTLGLKLVLGAGTLASGVLGKSPNTGGNPLRSKNPRNDA
jgi:hypothetical protein